MTHGAGWAGDSWELIPLAKKLWGIPLVVWGVLGLGISVVWLFVWPSDKVDGASALEFLVLRWFHAIVWLLLAAAAFMAAAGPTRARGSQTLGWMALATYAIFLIVMRSSG